MQDSTLLITRYIEIDPVDRIFELELTLVTGSAAFLFSGNVAGGLIKTQNLTVTNIGSAIFALEFFELLSSISVTKGDLTVSNRLYTERMTDMQVALDIGFTLPFKDTLATSVTLLKTSAEYYALNLDNKRYHVFGFSGQYIRSASLEIYPKSGDVVFLSNWPILPSNSNVKSNQLGFFYYEKSVPDFSETDHKPQLVSFLLMPDGSRDVMIPGLPIQYNLERRFREGISEEDKKDKTESELESLKVTILTAVK